MKAALQADDLYGPDNEELFEKHERAELQYLYLLSMFSQTNA